MGRIFHDRADAGRLLAKRLARFKSENPVIVAIPRGGVVVAEVIAEALDAPLDIVIVRKIGAPAQPEFGIGAIGEDGTSWINVEFANAVGATRSMLQEIMQFESEEIARRVKAIRRGQEPLDLKERAVILVDDGLATGATALVAARSLRQRGVKKVILAVPAGAAESMAMIGREVNETICLEVSDNFHALSNWYEDFLQVTDEKVIEILANANRQERIDVEIRSGRLCLPGELVIPKNALGLVIFAHGSGSSRLSPRNLQVGKMLNRAGLATLLFDLLTPQESEDRENIFDIDLLSERLQVATAWIRNDPRIKEKVQGLKIGYFGASTGAAAALSAAAKLGTVIAAVVSRGGRPDLTGTSIRLVVSPTLLIVGGYDELVLDLNRQVMSILPHARLVTIPGATHLFEEPGALERVAEFSIEWFTRHFSAPVAAPARQSKAA